ncbi:GNAT family N-acetyltransferase [Dokdonella soli]
MTDAHIRRATMGDLDALVELENSVFEVERMSARQLRRHLESLSAEVFVATRERRVVGAAVLFFRRASNVARLYSIAVAPSERGGGIGEGLLVAAEQAARRRGSRSLRLEVRSDNAGAQRLYERHGYHHFGLHRAYYEDGHDAQRYEKALA